MTTRTRVAIAAAGLTAAGAVLFGVTSAQAADTTPSAQTCRGPAASLSAEQCASFRADMKAARDSVFAKYGLTAPAKGDGQRHGRFGGQAASLTAEQRTALKSDLDAVRAQRDAVLAKYGIAVPAKGEGRGAVRDAVSKLSAEQQEAFKADMKVVREARDAALAKYGITAPRHGRQG